MESVDAIAQKLVSNVEQRTGGLLTLTDEWDELKQDIAAALTAERANVTREQTDRFLRLVTEVCPNPNCAGEFSSDDGLRQWLRASMSYFGREAPEGCHAPKGHVLDDCGTVRKEADIAAERAKFAAFADEKGEPMKAILTADGKLITQASPVWWWDGNVLLEGVASMSFNIVFSDPNVPAMLFTPNAGIGGVYSTKQAAEAAKENGQ